MERNAIVRAGKSARWAAFAALTLLLLAASYALPASALEPQDRAIDGEFVVLAWNDLGMHCSNHWFRDLCVLPPYNTVYGTLIRRGSAVTSPELVGPGYTLRYRLAANTYSVGKTDFWSWEDQLFGVQLPDNIGLTGKGLTGTLDWQMTHFEAVGIPITPFDDADLVHEQPFQLMQISAYDGQYTLLDVTEIVAPVSNEMTCNACHIPQGGETVEQSILRRHDQEEGTNLQNQRPVLCADCHASNALGMPGIPGLPSLSQAMHLQHGEETNDCYLCHPGPVTQCLRDVMSTQYGLTCQTCHGSTYQVGQSIEYGRRPWFDEPRCGNCHGSNYAESPGTLYRMSHNGHGGLFCSACHNSPHAILPSREERDNRQVVAVQGHTGTLSDCTVCHGVQPSGGGPHGLFVSGVTEPGPAEMVARLSVAPNPMQDRVEIRYRAADGNPLRLGVYDVGGRLMRQLTTAAQRPGDHALVWDGRDEAGRTAPAGTYYCRLDSGGRSVTARIVKVAD